MNQALLIVIVGPTAVGKTRFAIELAKELNAEILSADSRQFFKELNIGTAKPSAEELSEVKHHFIGHISIEKEYNASLFEEEALLFLENYFKSNSTAVVCGGSGMYIDALLKGFDEEIPTRNEKIRKILEEEYKKDGLPALQKQLLLLDPIYYEQVDLNNHKRLLRALEVCLVSGKAYSSIRLGKDKIRPFEVIQIGLDLPRPILYDRINRRVDEMIKEGLVDEVKSLLSYRNSNALKTVGYKELFEHFDGAMDLAPAIEKIKVNSRRYAKRQITWFKRNEEITWFKPEQKLEVIAYIRRRRKKIE